MSNVVEVRRETAQERAARASARVGGPAEKLKASCVIDFLAQPLEAPKPLMGGWLGEKTLGMTHAWRGAGKSWFHLSLGWYLAAGADFLDWPCPEPQDVLYIDGEMAASGVQTRLRRIQLGCPKTPAPGRFILVNPDMQDRPMPDLSTTGGQIEFDDLIEQHAPKLVIVDNLSCLARSGGPENDAESWGMVAQWALQHRRAERAILFVHHSGKGGQQRGTSKREDLLDTVLALKQPPDHDAAAGACFEIHFEKARNLAGGELAAIEATLVDDPLSGGVMWATRSVNTATDARVIEAWNAGGVSMRDIAREVGINVSTVSRRLKKAAEAGALTRPLPDK